MVEAAQVADDPEAATSEVDVLVVNLVDLMADALAVDVLVVNLVDLVADAPEKVTAVAEGMPEKWSLA